MKISEALQAIHAAPADAPRFKVLLACGFTPLHLQTFLAAHVQRARQTRKVELQTGLFGDLAGTLRRAISEPVHAVAIAMEWTDLDPRLGYRSIGGWGPVQEADFVAGIRPALADLEGIIGRVAAARPVVISLPTIPLPPAFYPIAAQAGHAQASIVSAVHDFAARMTATANVRLVNEQQLAIESPLASRLDLKSDLFTGFPYSLAHASCVAAALAKSIAPAVPKKGLITDLDDTLWNGIVGDAGPDKVSWDLSSHSQLHGLYQQTLGALADQGVLVAVASKNDPALVDETFARPDMILRKDQVFPLEVHWNAKSGSVGRVLKAWNIGADAVVFVDDSPMELAEVKQAFPDVECVLFPKEDYSAFEGFLRRLRDVFGKSFLAAEDARRLESLRNAAAVQQQAGNFADASDAFLSSLGAAIAVQTNAAADPRCLELINKTNQFNLNGRRYEEGEWREAIRKPDGFVWSVAYRDKFGPLGTIAVILGHRRNGTVLIDSWVMSCRAFARRIEHQTLKSLFEETRAEQIVLDFQATARNGPCADFIAALADQPEKTPVTLTKENFLSRCPPTFHELEWKS